MASQSQQRPAQSPNVPVSGRSMGDVHGGANLNGCTLEVETVAAKPSLQQTQQRLEQQLHHHQNLESLASSASAVRNQAISEIINPDVMYKLPEHIKRHITKMEAKAETAELERARLA